MKWVQQELNKIQSNLGEKKTEKKNDKKNKKRKTKKRNNLPQHDFCHFFIVCLCFFRFWCFFFLIVFFNKIYLFSIFQRTKGSQRLLSRTYVIVSIWEVTTSDDMARNAPVAITSTWLMWIWPRPGSLRASRNLVHNTL